MSDRAQLSTPVVEAGIGVVLILAIAVVFTLGVPVPNDGATQLDAYAEDAGTVLAGEPPRHQDATRLSEIARDAESFERERASLDRRLDRLLPDNLLYQVQTTHGSVGYQRPAGVSYGTATVTTQYGDVILRVWYA
ncbi:hypothetical protein SAMN06269185_1841 [Natronoarchaeum philippinense]|uniref:Uncharacterized protein n=1 Tax=Natronoarchaeum philippinense TaxID=558529 RepID=A0A285NT61_NATPI|nr:hypothetical protein [Natronoarchaeum philippinense]SNZ12629.1 hypothetical protein SAMN06269185_1841 [Natronoarchaeum philippinense]